MAEQLFAQYDSGDVNPARIMNQFTMRRSTGRWAALLTRRSVSSPRRRSRRRRCGETIIRVKEYSLEEKARHLAPTDIAGLQKLMDEKRALQAPDNCIFPLIKDKIYTSNEEDGHCMDENMVKFAEKLNDLKILAKKKKNVLEIQEINDLLLRHGTEFRPDGEGV